MKRSREEKALFGSSSASASKAKKTQQEKAKARKEKKDKEADDELPEVDQKLRQRAK